MTSQAESIFRPVQLAVAAAMGVLILLVNLAIGVPIIEATGIPASGGFVMYFFFTLITVFTRLVFNRFGGATLAAFIFSVLALAAPILGPPGFLPKIILAVVFGLLVDVSFVIFPNNEKAASILAGLLYPYVGLGAILLIFYLFLPPEPFAALLSVVPIFLAINWILGILGGLTGWWIYDRIRNRAVIQRIQGS